jgi:tetrathionate reductase subunit A
VLVHPRDGNALHLRNGDRVRLVTASNPEGKIRLLDAEERELDIVRSVKLTEGIWPGTVGVSWHFGHWAYGSQTVVVDDTTVHGDAARSAGVNLNPLLLADPVLKNVALTDKIGGSASFYDTSVKLIKV